MATKSILKTVCIRNRNSAVRLVRALEQSENQCVNKVKIKSAHVKEMDVDTIKKIWGNS